MTSVVSRTFDAWIADRGIEWQGELLGAGCLTDLPIVAADRTGQFEREIARRTFEHSRLTETTRLLLYDQVRQTWQRYQKRRCRKYGVEWALAPSSQQPA